MTTALPEIRPCANAADRHAIARLRYDVYIAEMERSQPSADHEARTIHEPLDARGMLLGAFLPCGRAVGTLRITPAPATDDAAARFYGWDGLDRDELAERCLASKLIVTREHRGSRLGLRLMRAATALGLRAGIRYCHLDTNAHLVAFYEAIGFVASGVREHPLFGSVTVMVWDLYDLEHMRRLRSPLLAEVARHALLANHAA